MISLSTYSSHNNRAWHAVTVHIGYNNKCYTAYTCTYTRSIRVHLHVHGLLKPSSARERLCCTLLMRAKSLKQLSRAYTCFGTADLIFHVSSCAMFSIWWTTFFCSGEHQVRRDLLDHQVWLRPPLWPGDWDLYLHEQDQWRDHLCHCRPWRLQRHHRGQQEGPGVCVCVCVCVCVWFWSTYWNCIWCCVSLVVCIYSRLILTSLRANRSTISVHVHFDSSLTFHFVWGGGELVAKGLPSP